MADLTINSDDLAALSLEQLADRFEAIERQGQLFQGQILLEARNRFPSNKEFGQWCAINSICVDSQQHRTRLMNLARFFASRELDKIGISAAYEIAAPVNADIAVEVYEYARGKNLPLVEVRKQIEMLKNPPKTVRIIPTNKPLITGKPLEEEREKIENVFSPTQVTEKVEDNSHKFTPENPPEPQDVKAKIMADLENTPPLIAMKILNDLLGDYRFRFYGKR